MNEDRGDKLFNTKWGFFENWSNDKRHFNTHVLYHSGDLIYTRKLLYSRLRAPMPLFSWHSSSDEQPWPWNYKMAHFHTVHHWVHLHTCFVLVMHHILFLIIFASVRLAWHIEDLCSLSTDCTGMYMFFINISNLNHVNQKSVLRTVTMFVTEMIFSIVSVSSLNCGCFVLITNKISIW